MTADKIKALLWQKYDDHGQWACFEELRSTTGYSNSINYIDFYALNCWPSKGYVRIAYEIKVSRGDFMGEMKKPTKRKFAMDNSHQFYFIAPKGVIKDGEVPKECGYILVQDSGRMVTKKIAEERKLGKEVSIDFIAAMARKRAEKPSFSKKIFKYAGQDLDIEQIEKIMDDYQSCHTESKIRFGIRDGIAEELKKKHSKVLEREESLKEVFLELEWGRYNYNQEDKIKDLKELLELMRFNKSFVTTMENLSEEFNEFRKRLKIACKYTGDDDDEFILPTFLKKRKKT